MPQTEAPGAAPVWGFGGDRGETGAASGEHNATRQSIQRPLIVSVPVLEKSNGSSGP